MPQWVDQSNWQAGSPGTKCLNRSMSEKVAPQHRNKWNRVIFSKSRGDDGIHSQTSTLCPSWAASPRAAVETGSIRWPISCTEDVSCSCSAWRVTTAENYIVSHHRKTTDPIKFFLSHKIDLMWYLNSLPWRYHLCRAGSALLQLGKLAQCHGCTYWCYQWSNHTPSVLVPCPCHQKCGKIYLYIAVQVRTKTL